MIKNDFFLQKPEMIFKITLNISTRKNTVRNFVNVDKNTFDFLGKIVLSRGKKSGLKFQLLKNGICLTKNSITTKKLKHFS